MQTHTRRVARGLAKISRTNGGENCTLEERHELLDDRQERLPPLVGLVHRREDIRHQPNYDSGIPNHKRGITVRSIAQQSAAVTADHSITNKYQSADVKWEKCENRNEDRVRDQHRHHVLDEVEQWTLWPLRSYNRSRSRHEPNALNACGLRCACAVIQARYKHSCAYLEANQYSERHLFVVVIALQLLRVHVGSSVPHA